MGGIVVGIWQRLGSLSLTTLWWSFRIVVSYVLFITRKHPMQKVFPFIPQTKRTAHYKTICARAFLNEVNSHGTSPTCSIYNSAEVPKNSSMMYTKLSTIARIFHLGRPPRYFSADHLTLLSVGRHGTYLSMLPHKNEISYTPPNGEFISRTYSKWHVNVICRKERSMFHFK